MRKRFRRIFPRHDRNNPVVSNVPDLAATGSGAGIQTSVNVTPNIGNGPNALTSVQVAKPPLPKPISCLWDDAYDELNKLDAGLVAQYNLLLQEALAESIDPDHEASKSQQMEAMIKLRLKTLEEKEWKLKFKGHELKVKDLVEPVVGIVTWAKDYVGDAVESSAPASIAWAGVCLLLPLLLNPSSQSAARVKALETLAETVSRCHLREALYQRRFGGKQEIDPASETYYQSFKSLCIKILTFQATCAVTLSESTLKRTTLDMFKWEDWDTLIAAVNSQEEHLQRMESLLNDLAFNEQLDRSELQHIVTLEKTISIHRELEHIAEMIDDARCSNSLRWLATNIDPSKKYAAAWNKHGQNSSSGDWLMKTGEFQKWIEEPNSLLWLHGQPGGGKTILSSTVIHHLKSKCKTSFKSALAYYFFDFQNKDTQTSETLLRSIVANIYRQRPSVPHDIEQWYRTKTSPSMEDLEDAMRASTEDLSSVFIVVDALDECPALERGAVLGVIQRLKANGPANLHFLLTSRPETDIRFSFECLLEQPGKNAWSIDLQLWRDEVNADIATVIDRAFKESPFANEWSSEGRSEARERIIQKAGGMFQYVALQIEALEGARNAISRQKILDKMPNGLQGLYDRILLDIVKNEDRIVAHRALQWLAFLGNKGISVGELAEIAIVDSSVPHANTNIDLLAGSRLNSPETILSMLQGLVVVSGSINGNVDNEASWHGGFQNDCRTVLLSHFTVKEYLVEQRAQHSTDIFMGFDFSTDEVSSKNLIAESRLWYFVYLCEVLDPAVSPLHVVYQLAWWRTGSEGLEVADSLPLECWTPRLKSLATKVLTKGSRSFDILWAIYKQVGPQVDDLAEFEWEDTSSRAGSTASFPLLQFVASEYDRLPILLLNENSNHDLVNRTEAPYGTALIAAARRGAVGTVRALLQAESDAFLFRVQGSEYTCALDAAITGGQYDCFVALLEDRDHLRRYSEEGNYRVLETIAGANVLDEKRLKMLDHLFSLGPDITCKWIESWPGAALFRAVNSDFASCGTIDFLIDKGWDVEGKMPAAHWLRHKDGPIPATALQHAVCNSRGDTIKHLILRGARVDPRSEDWSVLRNQLDASPDDLMWRAVIRRPAWEAISSQDQTTPRARHASEAVRNFQDIIGERYKTSIPPESTLNADMSVLMGRWVQYCRLEEMSGGSETAQSSEDHRAEEQIEARLATWGATTSYCDPWTVLSGLRAHWRLFWAANKHSFS